MSVPSTAVSIAKNPLLLSILCPVYNEEQVLPLFFQRMRPVIEQLSRDYRVDLIFLNNASTDQSIKQIEKIREVWPATYLITMSRNAGYHASLQCGLRQVEGDLFAFIDVDKMRAPATSC